jgi:hypothetical protein
MAYKNRPVQFYFFQPLEQMGGIITNGLLPIAIFGFAVSGQVNRINAIPAQPADFSRPVQVHAPGAMNQNHRRFFVSATLVVRVIKFSRNWHGFLDASTQPFGGLFG